MKKEYVQPELALLRFSFERLLGDYAVNSDPEGDIYVYDGENPNDPNDPDPSP